MGELDLLTVQLEEDVGLALERMRLDRLEQEVDRAGLVPLEDTLGIPRAGGQEDDRDVLGPLRSAHELGQLEAGHVRHLNVKDCQRHVVGQQQLQRLAAGAGRQEIQALATEQRLERHQVLLDVVHQQELDLVLNHRDSLARPRPRP